MAVYQPQAVQMMPMQAQPVGMPMQGQAMYAQQQPVVMAAPGVMAMQQPLVQGQFQTTELDCCAEPGGCGRCCYGYCCTACAFGKVAGSLQPGTACCAGNQCGACFLHASIGGVFYAGGVLLFGVGALAMVPIVSVFTSPLHYNVRKAFKAQNGIPHGPGCCPDLAYLCFCDPCVLCQELREIDLRRPVMTVMSPMPTMVTAPQPGVMMMSATVPAPQQPGMTPVYKSV